MGAFVTETGKTKIFLAYRLNSKWIIGLASNDFSVNLYVPNLKYY
jgi:hypothetical protein